MENELKIEANDVNQLIQKNRNRVPRTFQLERDVSNTIDEIFYVRNKDAKNRVTCSQIGNEAFKVYYALWKNGNIKFQEEQIQVVEAQ